MSPNQDLAYIFLAPTGMGKTTIISFLLANGYGYFSDDIIPVQERSQMVFSFPKALYVRNAEFIDSFNQNGQIDNTGTKLSLFDECKYVYSVRNKPLKFKSVVAKIVILDRRDSCFNTRLEKLRAQESFFELMKNLKDPENIQKSYQTISHLVKNVEILRLKYGNGVQQLQESLKVLSDDILTPI